MNLKLLLVLLCAATLSACNYEVTEETPPEIREFNIVDSYNKNSEFESGKLSISPDEGDGIFEVFWEVDSYYAHRVELYLNDKPYPDFGILLSSAWCGAGENCSDDSYQFCRYRSNLSMVCELPESYEIYKERDISGLFFDIPEQLHLVLEVCDEDLFYCEYQSLAVELE